MQSKHHKNQSLSRINNISKRHIAAGYDNDLKKFLMTSRIYVFYHHKLNIIVVVDDNTNNKNNNNNNNKNNDFLIYITSITDINLCKIRNFSVIKLYFKSKHCAFIQITAATRRRDFLIRCDFVTSGFPHQMRFRDN